MTTTSLTLELNVVRSCRGVAFWYHENECALWCDSESTADRGSKHCGKVAVTKTSLELINVVRSCRVVVFLV